MRLGGQSASQAVSGHISEILMGPIVLLLLQNLLSGLSLHIFPDIAHFSAAEANLTVQIFIDKVGLTVRDLP